MNSTATVNFEWNILHSKTQMSFQFRPIATTVGWCMGLISKDPDNSGLVKVLLFRHEIKI